MYAWAENTAVGWEWFGPDGCGHVEVGLGQEYERLHRCAYLRRALAWITRRPYRLQNLAEVLRDSHICGQRDLGLRTVPLRRIVGSEGRCDDFDRHFRPLRSHTRQRWYRIALARLQGVILPPVELTKVGQDYYVRDGHHRISVAGARGEVGIEALVIEYDLSRPAGNP